MKIRGCKMEKHIQFNPGSAFLSALLGALLLIIILVCSPWQSEAASAQVPSPGLKPTAAHPNPPSAEERAKQRAQAIKDLNIPGLKLRPYIPENFPIKPYPNAYDKGFVNSTSGKPTAGLTMYSKDAPDVVHKWYMEACREAKLNTVTPSEEGRKAIGKVGDLFIINADNLKQKLSIVLVRNPKDRGTIISISWALK